MKPITITAFYDHEQETTVANIEGCGKEKQGEIVDFIAGDLYSEGAEIWLTQPVTKIVARYDKETDSVIITLLGEDND